MDWLEVFVTPIGSFFFNHSHKEVSKFTMFIVITASENWKFIWDVFELGLGFASMHETKRLGLYFFKSQKCYFQELIDTFNMVLLNFSFN